MTQFETDDEEVEEESPKSLRQQLGRKDREMQELRQQLDQQGKDLAFMQIGLPDTPMASFFKENYKGEASEDVIRAQAAELGLIGSPTQATADAVQAIDQMSEDAAGGMLVMSDNEEAALNDALRGIKPGPNYNADLERVLREHGRQTISDFQ